LKNENKLIYVLLGRDEDGHDHDDLRAKGSVQEEGRERRVLSSLLQMKIDDLTNAENFDRVVIAGASPCSADHRLCKLCKHCPIDNQPPTYLVNAWCYLFMSGDHVDKQGYCGQFRLRPLERIADQDAMNQNKF
jgi:hypothetical protein